MSGNFFFDSNTLLYIASPDAAKADRTWELLDLGGWISVQVLNEMTSVARRKFKMSWPETHKLLLTVTKLLTVRSVTLDIHRSGLRLAERYGFSVYDSFIVAAALEADCDTLWSEDMQDGLLVEGRMRIANPFAA